MASERVETLVSQVDQLTVLELSELVKALETKYGVTAAAPMAMAMPMAGGAAGEAAAAEEQTEFNVILTDTGANKINVIKEVRALTSLGLKEAKDLVDNPPKPIKEGVTKEEAQKIKEKIEAAGGKVEIK
ncbi:50S ribosomal protein L7/L12 [bacterium]|nr:50S ribosomal protein L7/L12 [bacterium]